MSRRALRPAIVVVIAATAIAVGCSSQKAVGPADTAPAPSTSVTPTTAAPPTTLATTTTVESPVTDAPATTAVPAPAPAGWTVIEPSATAGPLAYPCCASNWYGVASPEFPAPGTQLADGIYSIELAWPTDFGQPVTSSVTRFERCSVLPPGSCEDNGGGAYGDDELGVDATSTFDLPLAFDDQLQVVLGGFAGNDGDNFATGNGLDMAALVTALDADYQVAIMQPYLAGMAQDEITAALTAAPDHGFSAPAEPFAGALVYTRDGAPPLLFQALLGYDDTPDDIRGSDIIGRIALVVHDGRLTINTYAGFYS